MLVQILLGVLTLLVLVAAFLATKVWHWAHVLVLVAFYFSCVGYLVLMSQSASIRWKYQRQEQQALANLERQLAENAALVGGTDDRSILSRLAAKDTLIADGADQIGGVRSLEHQVRMLNRDRGRVWRNAVLLEGVDQQTGTLTLGFPIAAAQPPPGEAELAGGEDADAEPEPLGLLPDAVVYLFEQGAASTDDPSAGRQYLGEFRVTAAEGRQATFEPLDQLLLDDYAGNRLLRSEGPWTVYESMPADDRRVFAGTADGQLYEGLSEEQLRALLPAASVEEYLRDGKEATDDDDPFRVEWLDADDMVVGVEDDASKRVKRRYRRQLRDYAFEFKDLSEEQAELVALSQATEADLAKLDRALASAEELKDFREDESSRLENDLELLRRDRAKIEQYVAVLKAQVAKAERLLAETLRANADLAARIGRAGGSLRAVATGALDVDSL